MTVAMTVDRLRERGRAMLSWEQAGGSVDRLARLDHLVRHGRCTDWPAPWPGYERRVGVPDLDVLVDAERREADGGR
jgi:hypothetical protein